MLDLMSIRVFQEIVETGSFSKAAERLDMSAPMVSKYMAKLEKHLGSRLLNRTSRHVSVTEAGQLYYEQTHTALDILNTASETVALSSVTPSGELKISAPVWFANAHFAQLLHQYQQQYPNVHFDLHLENHIVDIALEGFDLALRVTPEPAAGLIAKPLCNISFYLVGSPSYLQALGLNSQHLNNTQQTIHAKFIMPNYIKRALDSAALGIPNMQLAPVLKSNDNNLIRHAALSGMGLALLPEWLISEDLTTKKLMAVQQNRPIFEMQLYAVYTSRKYMPLKLRTLIDFLAEHLK
ncbi:MAG TPA: LysR family transcriptional regulator [Methylophilaceae bacterium]|nr:LysR family transcriptional regulator [Methylophilaceae bacterium]HAJ71909.1 LysR family transcriptional regulator [Methylophilaceae bacterium]